MNQSSRVKRATVTAVCIALCVVLPLAFHSIPRSGVLLGPMHFPVLLCGLLCGWPFGLLCGLFGPLLSSLVTAMPPIPILPGMMAELAVYGLVAGFGMKFIRTKRIYADLYLSLIAAMVLGRVAAGAATALIFAPGSLTMGAWVTGYFAAALPGIVLQLALLPTMVFALQKARLIPPRYPVGNEG